jgi:hypothetical protein
MLAPTPLSVGQVRQWREEGFVLVKGLVDVAEAEKSMKAMYPLKGKDSIKHDFGSGSDLQFPIKDCPSLNNITLHPTLIAAATQLLARGGSATVPKLLQSVAWAKFGDVPDAEGSDSNHEQRVHMDYGNNTWLHPPQWDAPTAVAAIVYYSDVSHTGGGTAVTPRQGPHDPIYEYPYRHMPGQGVIFPFVNNKDKAEALVKTISKKSYDIRQEAYRREIKTCPSKGDVLLYRLDVWHRGTPVNPGTVRYVHNLLWTLPDTPGMCTRNPGFTIPMYYGWLEKYVATLEPIQLLSLGFPSAQHPYWTKQTVEGVKMRYGSEAVDRLLASRL